MNADGQPQNTDKSRTQIIRELRSELQSARALQAQAEQDAAKILAMCDSLRGELLAVKARLERMRQAAPDVWAAHCSKEALRRSKRAAARA
jgi:uncharacterized membrane protein